MFKKRPIASLIANVEATSIFRRSKVQNKNYLKEPEWEHQKPAGNMIMTKVLNKRRNEEILEQQEKICEEVKVKGRKNKKRLKEVRNSQKELREKFIETNDFINDCEQKIAEMDKRIATEMEIQKKLLKNIDEYEEKIRKLADYNENELKPYIEELSIFEDVLQEVVDEMDMFESKEDLLDRIESLLLVQEEVAESDKTCLEGIEQMQADIIKISNEATLKIAGFENQQNQLEKKCDEAKSDCLKLENVMHSSKEIIAEKEKEVFMMLDQIQQMYLLLCNRKGEAPKFKREQIEEQLDYIKREIEIITEIIELAHEMETLETRSDIASHGSGKSGKPRK